MKKRHASTHGIALVAVLVLLAATTLLIFGTVFMTQIDLRISRNDSTFTQANYAAQAGLEKYKTALFQNFRWYEDYVAGSGDLDLICSNQLAGGLDLGRTGVTTDTWDGNHSISLPAETVTDAAGDPIGTFRVTFFRDPVVKDYYIVRSVGESSGATATVEATLSISRGGILKNAVFAGQGGGNKKYNGGAIIRGGVYIEGDPTRPDEPMMDANGNFIVHNEYDLNDMGRYGDVASRVVEDAAGNLCANVRVGHGQLAVGGSTQLGTPDNRLQGVYVDSGTQDILTDGNKDPEDTCKENKGICADDVGAFDIDPIPTLPEIDDLLDVDGCNDVWRTCLDTNARNHGLLIDPTDASFTDLLAQCQAAFDPPGSEVVFDDVKIECRTQQSEQNVNALGFVYDPTTSPAQFRTYGDVSIRGFDVRFARDTVFGARSHDDTNSTTGGSGTLSVLEDIGAGGNLRFDGSFVPDSFFAPYPDQVLGIVGEHVVHQAGPHLVAPVYAGDMFRTEHGNVLYGNVITDEFCTTSAGSNQDPPDCNAGQTSEVVYLDTGLNTPESVAYIDPRGGESTFRVKSYNLR